MQGSLAFMIIHFDISKYCLLWYLIFLSFHKYCLLLDTMIVWTPGFFLSHSRFTVEMEVYEMKVLESQMHDASIRMKYKVILRIHAWNVGKQGVCFENLVKYHPENHITIAWKCEWVNEWMTEWMNKWMNNEWMNERTVL